MTIACVQYGGNVSTTDVWDQCTFQYTPKGVVINNGVNIRFTNCLFETLDVYGVEIESDSRSIEFVSCYSEDVPGTTGATNAMFKVGYTGTTPSLSTILKVTGGNWTGKNSSNTGSFLDADDVTGIQLVGPYVARYTNLINTTANTADYAIEISGLQFNQCNNTYNDLDKLSGFFDDQAVNAATGPIAKFRSVRIANSGSFIGGKLVLANGPQILADGNSPEGAITSGPGSLFLRNNGGAGTTLYVKESGTGNTGWVAK